MTRRTLEQERADRTEHDRRSHAYFALIDSARLIPGGAHDPEKIARRSGAPLAEVHRILSEYDAAPHIHSVAVWHDFGRPCRLGNHHPGCCPRTKGCDAPGELPRH